MERIKPPCRTTEVSFGPYMCEEASELLADYRKVATGATLGEPVTVYWGTQLGWQIKVNRALASRGQAVDFSRVKNPDNRFPPDQVHIHVYAVRETAWEVVLYQELFFPD